MEKQLPTYGGQAVIEGVMMRGSKSVAIAMRDLNQEIVIHTEELSGIYKSRLIKIPFLRGLIGLWDSLVLGMRALTISANLQTGEDEQLEGAALYLTLGLSLVFSIGLFFIAPAATGQLVEKYLHLNAWWGNLAEGLVRLLLLVGYIWVIGLMPDIQRVFAYHGSEHKTINAFEAGVELTPENVAKHSCEHPRCGTAFLLTLVLISILIFSLLGPLPLLWRLVSRVAFIPILAGLAYEYIRWTANNLNSPIVRLIIKPNLALQRLTTREPSLEIIEVGIAAFKAMQEEEQTLIT
ncbi:MAG: DUF1385 domain-containing protein [Anaerolineales bacterium]|nr:DUF1385 domain-containing protein [Anaerolineales bacterium]